MICIKRLAICAIQNFYLCFIQNQDSKRFGKGCQCQLFNIVPICAKNVQKADQNPRIFEKVKPMQIFLTRGAGCGKSILMKIIHPSLTLSYGDVVIKKSISIAYGTCCYAN